MIRNNEKREKIMKITAEQFVESLARMSDEEKLEAFADILLENIKLKKQLADLKAKK